MAAFSNCFITVQTVHAHQRSSQCQYSYSTLSSRPVFEHQRQYRTAYAVPRTPHYRNSEHFFLPYRIERRTFTSPAECRTTTAPIARPPPLHAPRPDRQFVEAPLWLSEQGDMGSGGNMLPTSTAYGTTIVNDDDDIILLAKTNISQLSRKKHLDHKADCAFVSFSPTSSVQSVWGNSRTSPSSTSQEFYAADSSVWAGEDIGDIVLETLMFAQYLLEINYMWENSYRKNWREDLLRQWRFIYTTTSLLVARRSRLGSSTWTYSSQGRN